MTLRMNGATPLKIGRALASARPWRLLGTAVALASVVAVGLGRSAVETSVRRRPGAASRLEVRPGRRDWSEGRSATTFLDPTTGRRLEDPSLDNLARVAWAPWTDDRGGTQLVASEIDGSGAATLVRLTLPGGAVLDRIPADGLPCWSGPPCWFADGSTRILLAGADGTLYRLDFPERFPSDAPRPVALPWEAGPDEPPPALLADVTWPADPRLGGRVLVATMPRGRSPRDGQGWSLRWLRLDPGAASVVAAGPILRADSPKSDHADARHPAVGTGPDGRPWLAYLERPTDAEGRAWRLRAAPLEFADGSGDPSLCPSATITLAYDASSVAPTFANDGRSLSYVPVYESAAEARPRAVPLPAPRLADDRLASRTWARP